MKRVTSINTPNNKPYQHIIFQLLIRFDKVFPIGWIIVGIVFTFVLVMCMSIFGIFAEQYLEEILRIDSLNCDSLILEIKQSDYNFLLSDRLTYDWISKCN